MRAQSGLAIAAASFLLAGGACLPQQGAPAEWKEVAWPFLRDAWPNGRAFECVGGACGVKLALYARVKNGFCDCSRGVADDDEIDRVGDVMLVAPEFHPLATSEPRPLAGMAGRTRLYETMEAKPHRVLSLAGGRDCNAFSAIAVGDVTSAGAAAAAALINTLELSRWIALKQSGG